MTFSKDGLGSPGKTGIAACMGWVRSMYLVMSRPLVIAWVFWMPIFASCLCG
jgi:hypothetical protein